jgi:Flp pilus assembly protein protease CpaA
MIQQSPERDRRIARWLIAFVVVASAVTAYASYFDVGIYGAIFVAAVCFIGGMLGV